MNELSDISEELRQRRLEAGLSQTQLARRADTSVPTLSRYENGWSRFELSTLRKLATALGCELVVKLRPKPSSAVRLSSTEVVERIQRLFWDTPLEVGHLEENALWVVERVLEFGDLDDIRTLVVHQGRERFLRNVAEARLTSVRARAFWKHMLEKEGMTCTRKFSREEAASSWRSSSR